MISRRAFLETVSAAVVLPALEERVRRPTSGARRSSTCTSIMRPQPASNLAHLDGAGITKANLLTRGAAQRTGRRRIEAAAPGRFTWFSTYDITKPDAEQALTQAVKDGRAGLRRAEVPRRRRRPGAAPDLCAGG